MTRKIILAATLLMVSFSALGQASMRFVHTSWDFGTIQEAKGAVSHRFEFTNNGKSPLVIENIEVSCGCTTVDFPRKPVMPGQKGHITVTFDPENRPGDFNKLIVIIANNRSLHARLTVIGTVIERVRSVEELYPIDMGNGIRITDQTAAFRNVAAGKSKSISIGWVNTSKRTMKLTLSAEPNYKYLKINAPETLCAGCKGNITVTYDFSNGTFPWGVYSSNIFLVVDARRLSTPVSAIAYCVDDVEKGFDPDDSPRLRMAKQYHDFGDLAPDAKPVSTTLTLTNSGAKPLIVRHVSAGKGVTCTLTAGTVIAPDKSINIGINFDPDNQPRGNINQNITLIVNDPLRPVRQIRLAAYIK